jgi:hypothetical protein
MIGAMTDEEPDGTDHFADVVVKPMRWRADSANAYERRVALLVAAAIRARAEGWYASLHDLETGPEQLLRLGIKEHARAINLTVAELEAEVRDDLENESAWVVVIGDGDDWRAYVTHGMAHPGDEG